MTAIAHLPERGVVALAGKDRVGFLQGLVSNDIPAVAPGNAVWAALLSPQGKWVADFFVLTDGGRLLLDCERDQASDIIARLSRYKLRSQVELRAISGELSVYAAWNGKPQEIPAGAILSRDPRLPEAGWRILSPIPLAGVNAGAADYDRHRLSLGLPDGTRDLEPEKTLLLEAGFDELHGVSFSKGCYLGQEMTARTKHRGLMRRRLVPVAVLHGDLPAPGAPIISGAKDAGTMRSGRDGHGLAFLKMEALEGPLRSGETDLVLRIPAWMVLPA